MSIRVLLVALPRIMREIVEHAFAEAPDLDIVGSVDGLAALDATFDKAQPDVLVVGLDQESDARQLDPYLYRDPRLTCFAIAGDARSAFLYELRPSAKPLGDVSPEGLVRAIRSRQRAEVL